MDPYVVLKLGGNKWTSKVCKDGGKTPNWVNESATLRRATEDLLNFEVWDKDKASKDDLIG